MIDTPERSMVRQDCEKVAAQKGFRRRLKRGKAYPNWAPIELFDGSVRAAAVSV